MSALRHEFKVYRSCKDVPVLAELCTLVLIEIVM